MITIGYSTRETKPELIEYFKKTCGGGKNVEVIEKVNNGQWGLAEVYNQILTEAKNNIIVFCHDDIEFDTKNWGEKLTKLFNRNPEYGIIGIAGTTDLIDGRWWKMKESMTGIVSHKHEGKKWTNNYSEDQGNKLKEVVILDGLFFAVDRTKIKNNFDESFKGFHFYDIPFCFSNHLSGVKLAVTTQIKVTHMSIGQTNQQWEENKIQFEEKFKDNLPVRLTNNQTLEERMILNIDKVGIGMTTYNAEHRIKQSAFTVPKWMKHFVIVNDGTPYDSSSYPEQAHLIQHETNMSVGAAKNSAMKYLLDQGCEHIFLMEDDILIKDEKVFEEYVKHSVISGIKHLNFALHGPANKKGSTGFKTLEDRKDVDGEPNPRLIIPYPEGKKIALYPNCVGAFSYYHKSVLDKIGLFDPMFKNAWEHVEHTFQAIKNNFHPPFWYFADLENSWEYLTDIPNSIQESTIARTPEWNENFRIGTEYYKKKHGITPTETPLLNPQSVYNVINYLYNKR
jgi:glycosyltransferase involved in cell wall biosynthesis